MPIYTIEDKSRMRYWLKELKDKLAKNPDSLTLRNGIARVEEILEVPRTVESVDSEEWIKGEMARLMRERKGR